MEAGQGEPLPSFMECEGQWIIENYLYLYYSDSSQSLSNAPARFTVGVPRTDGGHCYGIDATQLALALGTDAATVIEANRNRTLLFLGITDAVPRHGGTKATTYTFQIGEARGSLTMESGVNEGAA